MESPIQPKPILAKKIRVQAGQKCSLCSCGQSKTLPYCDDSHRQINEEKKTNFKPVKFWPDKDVEIDVYCSNWEKKG